MPQKQLKVLILSMNCADVELTKAHIDLIAKESLFNSGSFDVVVVGEQETKGSKIHSYIADRLGALKPNDYTWGADDSSPKGKSRVTMTGTLGTGKHQSLGCIWKKDIDGLVAPFDEAARKSGKIKGHSKKGWHTGKGGVVLNLGIGNNELSFMSCHLNDEKTEKRATELKALFDAMPGTATASFAMGDFNERPMCIQFKQGTKGEKRDDWIALSVDDFFKMLVTPAERTKFMNMHDPFINGKVKAAGWTFPKPDFFPTYKRVQGVAIPNGANVDALKKAYWSKCAGPDGKQELPYSDPKTTSVLDKRPGEYGIGWLDRVGYKGKVTDVTTDALHNITVSDHTPVMMTCKVTIDHA